MKIKLPRKRKKYYLKAKGPLNYLGVRMVNEIHYEENPVKRWTRFPEFDLSQPQIKIKFNY